MSFVVDIAKQSVASYRCGLLEGIDKLMAHEIPVLDGMSFYSFLVAMESAPPPDLHDHRNNTELRVDPIWQVGRLVVLLGIN